MEEASGEEGGDRDGEAEADSETKRETDREGQAEKDRGTGREGQKDRQTSTQRHEALPRSPPPSCPGLSAELAAFLDSPGTRSTCWGPWPVAGARGTAFWSQSRSTGSGGPWAWQLRLKGVLAATVLSSGSSKK